TLQLDEIIGVDPNQPVSGLFLAIVRGDPQYVGRAAPELFAAHVLEAVVGRPLFRERLHEVIALARLPFLFGIFALLALLFAPDLVGDFASVLPFAEGFPLDIILGARFFDFGAFVFVDVAVAVEDLALG